MAIGSASESGTPASSSIPMVREKRAMSPAMVSGPSNGRRAETPSITPAAPGSRRRSASPTAAAAPAPSIANRFSLTKPIRFTVNVIAAGCPAPISSKTLRSGGTATTISTASVMKDMPMIVIGYIIVFIARCFASWSCSSMSASCSSDGPSRPVDSPASTMLT